MEASNDILVKMGTTQPSLSLSFIMVFFIIIIIIAGHPPIAIKMITAISTGCEGSIDTTMGTG